MKKLLLFLTFIFPCILHAQEKDVVEIPQKDGKYMYEEIVTPEGSHSKDALFVQVKTGIVNLFSNSKNGIQLEDKDAGKIVMKAHSDIKQTVLISTYYYDLNYMVDISIKENRYRIQLYDIDIVPTAGSMMPYKTINQIKEQSIKGAMKKSNKDLLIKIDANMKATLLELKSKIQKAGGSDF